MNKKVYGIIGVVALIILLIICCSIKPNTNETTDSTEEMIENITKEAQAVKEKEKKEFTEINVEEYLNKYNSEEKSIVLVARPTCHYCQIAEPILHNLAYKYNININYLNIDNFKDDDAQRFIESDELFDGGLGTPMLLVISNENINDMIDGVTDTRHYIEFLKENKFIK